METMGRHIALPCRNVGKPRPQVTWLDQDKKKIVSGKKYQVRYLLYSRIIFLKLSSFLEANIDLKPMLSRLAQVAAWSFEI